MPCPTCRASAPREAIAPGYFRCTNELYYVRSDIDGITPRPVYYTCNTNYQEVPAHVDFSTPQCRCGTFAIARCTLCGQPLCGDHRRGNEGRWACGSCVERRRQQQYEHKVNVERAEQERYQLLPEWTREELAEWMTGRSEQLVDGEHRQGQSWTNLGVATLIAAELGIGRNVHVGDGKKYSRPRVLTPDGFIVDLETSYSGLSDYWVPGLIAAGRTLGNPASLFNAGRPDGYDISKLPAIFRDAREELRSQGDVLLINDKYERPTKSSDGPNPFLFIALLLLVDAVLGVILLVNGLSS